MKLKPHKECYKIPLNKWEGFAVDKDGYLLVQNERVVLLSEVKQLINNRAFTDEENPKEEL